MIDSLQNIQDLSDENPISYNSHRLCSVTYITWLKCTVRSNIFSSLFFVIDQQIWQKQVNRLHLNRFEASLWAKKAALSFFFFLSVAWTTVVQLLVFVLLQCSSGVVRHPGDLRVLDATRSCRVLIFASS